MNDEQKISLTDHQHKELIMFAEQALQDIRDTKANQRHSVVSALVLLGATLALLKKLKNPSPCVRSWMAALVVAICIAAVCFLFREQGTLIRFRQRLKKIYDNHFTLNLEPIIGTKEAYARPRSFSRWGDLVILHIGVRHK